MATVALRREATVAIDSDTLLQPAQTLAEALARLGLRPFTLESVKHYQRRMIQRATPWRDWWLSRLYAALPRLAALALAIFAISLVLLASVSSARGWYGSMTIGALVCFFGAMYCLSHLDYVRVMRPQWLRTRLIAYKGPLPGYVRETADTLEKIFPSAELYIDELYRGSVLLDPFLVAVWRGREFYLEVWDEDGFSLA